MNLNRLALYLCVLSTLVGICRAGDPLPSWTDAPSKKAIIAFVENVTNKDSRGFVPVAERIAVFDNDGTLWPENPLPFQIAFSIDELRRQLPEHPEWKDASLSNPPSLVTSHRFLRTITKDSFTSSP